MMKDKFYVFFDIETSISADIAVKISKPPVIAIAALAVCLETQEIVDRVSFKIKFKKELADKEILDLIGYSDDIWADAEFPAVVANKFSCWLRKWASYEKKSYKGGTYYNCIPAGHNVVRFDIPTLINWYGGLSKHFGRGFWVPMWYTPYVDTLQMAIVTDGLFGHFKNSYSLKSLADEYNIPLEHHNPLSDVNASFELWKIYFDILKGYSISKGGK